jgi:tryptophan-rich sensory protein
VTAWLADLSAWPLALPTAAGVAWALVVAGLGGWLTDVSSWYQNLRFPSWRPPDWLFGPAWTAIFICIVAAGVLAWRDAPSGAERALLIGLFLVNTAFNVAWSLLFFRLRRPDWALVDVVALWASIVALIIGVGRFSTDAALLLAPYLAWVSFAAFLNWTMVRLNPRTAPASPGGATPARSA